MKRPTRLKQPRLLRRDWIGDGILMLLAGSTLVVSVFLPWANEDISGQVNYSVSMPDGIRGVLQTQWGAPAIILGLCVIGLGVAVTLTTPRRLSWVLGVLAALLGVAVLAVANDAAGQIAFMSPGLGLYLTVLVGVLLVPIGLAAALVAWVLARAAGRAPDAPPAPTPPATVPPAPESAPPS